MRKIRYHEQQPPAVGEAVEVAESILWIRMPLPFILDHINLWAIDEGDGWTLVDTGIKMPNLQRAWEKLLAGPLSQKPVRRVIVTHMHPDHMGLAGWLCERLNAPLYMTAEEYFVGRSLTLGRWDKAPPEIMAFFKRTGLSLAEQELVDKAGYGHFADTSLPPPAAFCRLRDGMTLNLGAQTFQVKVGRGHSPEHACLIRPHDGLMISGDQLLPKISSNISVHAMEPEADPLAEWLDSLAEMAQLSDDTLVLPAHGLPFYGAAVRAKALIAEHEDRLNTVRALCRTPQRAIDLLPHIFKREVVGRQILLAAGEATAHLHYLRERGELTFEDDADGVRWFSVPSS
ncbi:MAG: MBL fold metallo-hydrolase [Sphingomonadales bacterium]|nr:MBL fold metallo-hydrolase [Sphingomonadales bacterium]